MLRSAHSKAWVFLFNRNDITCNSSKRVQKNKPNLKTSIVFKSINWYVHRYISIFKAILRITKFKSYIMKQKIKIIGDYSTFELEHKVNDFLETIDCNQVDEIQYSTLIDPNGTFYCSCLISYFIDNG